MKTALITGITGQDGSYLSELLLEKGYQVVGLVSQDHDIGYHNINHLKDKLTLETGDLLDKSSLLTVISKHKPQEIYNLAGITYIPTSWDKPTLALDINTLGVARLLEVIIEQLPEARFYQASSSKIFGNPDKSPQDESTPIRPQDPYSVSKAASHYLTQIFRVHHHLFACSGILYNHESERRGPEFVTRKISQAAARIKLGKQKVLKLGNLDAKQDWGYAPDYVQAMWLMLQHDQPDDYVVSSGQYHTVKDICHTAFSHLGLDYQDYYQLDTRFVRQEKITTPLGNSEKARNQLGWTPQVDFKHMIVRMVEHDLNLESSGKSH